MELITKHDCLEIYTDSESGGQTKCLTNKYYYIVRSDDWVFGIVDSVYSV